MPIPTTTVPESEGVRTCSGPDRYGACPQAQQGETPICEGAEWVYGDESKRGWRFALKSGSHVCPAAVLDPLGPALPPLD